VYYTFGETETEKLKRLEYLNQEFRDHPNTASEDKLKQLEELTDSLRDNDFEAQQKQIVSTGASNITVMRATIAKAKEAERSAYASSIKAKQVVDYVQDYINNEGNEENLVDILNSICINPNKESIIKELKTKVNVQKLNEMIEKSGCKEIKDIVEADKRKEKEKLLQVKRDEQNSLTKTQNLDRLLRSFTQHDSAVKSEDEPEQKHEGVKLELSPVTPVKGVASENKKTLSIPPLEPATPAIKSDFKSRKRRVY